MLLCLDGLDAAFKADAGRRQRGLEGLFSAWQASAPRLRHLFLKVFLRTDLWERLSFPEKSHMLGAVVTINWDASNLWRLLVKRALNAEAYREQVSRAVARPALSLDAVVDASDEALEPYLDGLFERRIWAGKNALSRNWILRRLADAKEAVYPRDLLFLLKQGLDIEAARVREHKRVTPESVISRESLSQALNPCSSQRVQAVLEESPELERIFAALRGLPSKERVETLRGQLEQGEPGVSVDGALDRLEDAGVLARVTVGDAVYYQVPDLYRHGLGMYRMGPR